MSTEDPFSGILRFSWTVILQPLFFLAAVLVRTLIGVLVGILISVLIVILVVVLILVLVVVHVESSIISVCGNPQI